MTLQDRAYQDRMIDEARVALRTSRAVLMQLPTGGGKTVMAAKMGRSAHDKGLRAWFICHRDFLLQQTSLTFDRAGLPHSFIARGYEYDPTARFHICSIDTLKRRLDRLTPPNLNIWDEAHHTMAAGWARVFDWSGRSKHIGLSATPIRLDGKGLGSKYQHMVTGPSVAELIAGGFLSDYRAFAPSKPNLDGVHTVAGDYNRGEIENVMDDGQIIGDMVGKYKQLAAGRRAIYFCVSISHSKHVAATFQANGVRATHLDGNSSTDERAIAARAMARGELDVICNVDLFGEGYDLSAQAGMDVTIEAVGLARPTQSLALHLQQIGRALRPKDQPALILDHAGNLMKHGLPDDDREWTLEGMKKKKSGEQGAPVRQCLNCFGVFPAAKSACPYCGTPCVVEGGGRGVEEIEGDLQEVDKVALRRSRQAEERSARDLPALIDLAKRRGYKNPEKWASFIWTARTRYADQVYAGHDPRPSPPASAYD